MTTEAAVRWLQSSDDHREIVEAGYLDRDTRAAADRFNDSPEFRATMALLGSPIDSAVVLDVGAGTGIASYALARHGAACVIAFDPDRSPVIGLGTLTSLASGLAVRALAGLADAIPLCGNSVDVVFCRQVLHHLYELEDSIVECARVLRPGGVFVACREHVVDSDEQLRVFLVEHPVHQLAGGEHAHSLPRYRAAIADAGLIMHTELGPWDSIVNAYPAVRSADEMQRAPQIVLARRVGPVLAATARLPGVRQMLWRRLRRDKPGRLYTFVATKPG